VQTEAKPILTVGICETPSQKELMKLSRSGWFSIALAAGVVCSAAGLIAAQTSEQASNTNASIAGIVTKEPGSEPVKKAVIELIAESQSKGANYTALSGTDGAFSIENVVPGRYRLFVERTGFREIDKRQRPVEGRSLTLIAGQQTKDLAIHVQAAAVIEGRVTDEDGDPMPEAQVAVYRMTFTAARGRWEQVRGEATNDLGEYRIAGLDAGNYFVSVTPPPDFRSLIETASNSSSSTAANKSSASSYQTTYYPGTRDRGQATAIPLHGGDDFPVNFSLVRGQSFTVRGSVAGLGSNGAATIMLKSKDFNLMLNGAEMHKDGTFEIRDVSPGAYTIMATIENAAVPMTAHQSMQVAGNIEGIRLTPQPGGSIRGRLRVEGGTKSDLSQMFLMLRSTDGDDGIAGAGLAFADEDSNLIAHINTDGSFEWTNVAAGQYFVEISNININGAPDCFLKSVMMGGRNAMDSGIEVGGGANTIDLLASANGGIATGMVTDSNNQPSANAVIVAVPDPLFRSRTDRFRKVTTDQSGHFVLRGLPPGDYTIFAWESVEGDAYYNPDFLRNYDGQGKALHVNEGDHLNLQVKVIAENDDQL
jgi:Carboxypeptidase regulatory-like domain